jgi:phospholipid/cholesterol/gamma-HCH transport system ATP-binding protein
MTDEPSSRRIHLEVQDLRLTRGSRKVFEGLSCVFRRGEISLVLGPSGGGKTTLLRMIACLSKPDSGEIWLDSETELTCMPEHQAKDFRRNIGMMFQGGALLDAMTVFENAALPLREHTSMSEGEIAREVDGVFDSVGLVDVDKLMPRELSGGMTRRAALARALILKPDILLCDEPFSGLDPATVRLVESLLVEVNRRLGITMIITSHDIASTLRLAAWTVLLAEGSAISGSPAELRHSPDPRVKHFFIDDEPVPGGAGTAVPGAAQGAGERRP